MLPKKNRLVKKEDYEKVWKYGKSLFEKIVSLRAQKNNLNISRFGFIVGLKVSKKAVKRNRIRRQLQEIIRLKIKTIKPGYDILIVALPKILDKKYWEIDEVIEKGLKKMGLLE